MIVSAAISMLRRYAQLLDGCNTQDCKGRQRRPPSMCSLIWYQAGQTQQIESLSPEGYPDNDLIDIIR